MIFLKRKPSALFERTAFFTREAQKNARRYILKGEAGGYADLFCEQRNPQYLLGRLWRQRCGHSLFRVSGLGRGQL